MQTLKFEFPARRYHATPWDAHVNEGRIEWPPCPWRLLRSFIAVGYTKLSWGDTVPEEAQRLLRKLAACDPEYILPRATVAHTRHYMPCRSGKTEKKTKTFDTFLKMPTPEAWMLIRYNVELNSSERELLRELVASMAYLGRAESWVEGKLLEGEEVPETSKSEWIRVSTSGDSSRQRLLAPLESDEYTQWRESEIEQAITLAAETKKRELAEKGKKVTPAQLKKVRVTAEIQFPENIISALQQSNPKWQKEGWPRPPGSRWVDYSLPGDLFDQQPLLPLPVNSPHPKPTSALFAIDGEGKRGTLRPLRSRMLPLLELLHSESVRYAAQFADISRLPELTGMDEAGKPLRGQPHARWIPLSLLKESRNRHVDHVLVYCESGLPAEAIQALGQIRWAYAKGREKLSVNLVGKGSISEMYDQLSRNPVVEAAGIRVIKPAKVFSSVTPMVLRKYLSKGKKSFEGQIREELAEYGFPDPVRIERIPNREMVKMKLKGFLLKRQPKKNQPPFEASWAARIHFENIVQPPLCLGYASYYGLGNFGADD